PPRCGGEGEPRGATAKRGSEFALPKRDPRLDLERHVCWRTEEMNVIGHDHVPTDEPAIGLAPHFHQRLMDDGICQVLFALLRTDGEENNCGLPKKDEDALSRVAALFKRRGAVRRLDSVSPYQIRTREPFTVGRDAVEPLGGTHGKLIPSAENAPPLPAGAR